MPKKKRTRRNLDDLIKQTLAFAKKGPFSPQELAAKFGFTANRARQLLEQLKSKKKLKELGKRKSVRGKPATIWGIPGTKLTEADKAARPPSLLQRGQKAIKAAEKSWEDFHPLQQIVDMIAGHGIEIHAPGGLVLTLKAAKEKPARKAPAKKKKKKAKAKRKKAASKKKAKAPAKKKSAAKRKTKAPAKKKAAPKRKPAKKKVAKPKKKAAKRMTKAPARRKKRTPAKKATTKNPGNEATSSGPSKG